MTAPARNLPHETKLLLAAEGALFQRGARAEQHLMDLIGLVAGELSSGADPAWRLLRGAAQAYVSIVDRRTYPHTDDITRLLKAAITLAHRAPVPDTWQPKYTGGALRDFQKEA